MVLGTHFRICSPNVRFYICFNHMFRIMISKDYYFPGSPDHQWSKPQEFDYDHLQSSNLVVTSPKQGKRDSIISIVQTNSLYLESVYIYICDLLSSKGYVELWKLGFVSQSGAPKPRYCAHPNGRCQLRLVPQLIRSQRNMKSEQFEFLIINHLHFFVLFKKWGILQFMAI